MAQTSLLDDLTLDIPEDKTGFRLQRFEVLNWGTFHNKIWTLPLDGENALLTGEIGSGKSTLVDGLVTLLYPYQKITYNQAAGAKGRERSLLSYVRGDYRQAESGSLSLRDPNNHSVLLASFYNLGLQETITLATVFWFQPQGDLARFYLVAQSDLNIQTHFLNFGAQIKQLRSQLKKLPHVETFDSFKDYQDSFSQRFGIRNEQAMNLFYQTVSLKSVGNLTDFIRHHMLEIRDFAPDIERLKQEFDDLNQAHEAVVKARQQLDLLGPIMTQAQTLKSLQEQTEMLQGLKAGLPIFLDRRRLDLLRQQAQSQRHELELQQAREQEIGTALEHEESELLNNQIAHNTDPDGARLHELNQELERQFDTRDRLKRHWDRYLVLSEALHLLQPRDLETFGKNRQLLSSQEVEIQSALLVGEQQDRELFRQISPLQQRSDSLEHELASLVRRKTQLPEKSLALRRQLTESLGLDETDLPYVAELVRVRESDKPWEGAIERVLHSFALSLLVPEPHYAAVSEWVEQNQLNLRLVYYKLPEKTTFKLPELSETDLFCKLEFKAHPLTPWVQSEVLKRFNLTCCENLSEFRRQREALTRLGQIKTGGRRHEKDDRYRLDDPSYFVLGWNNLQKVRALQDELQKLTQQRQHLDNQQQAWQKQRKESEHSLQQIHRILEIDNFADLDYHGVQADIERLQRQIHALELTSDRLKHLKKAIEKGQSLVAGLKKDRDLTIGKCALLKDQVEKAQAEISELENQDLELPFGQSAQIQALLTDWKEPEHLTELKTIALRLQQTLEEREAANRQQTQTARKSVIEGISAWRHTYPTESSDLAVSEEALPELEVIYQQLQADDLPRFQSRFLQLLQTETTHSLLIFNNELEEASREIKRKINQINKSLAEIDYTPGTYIVLQMNSQTDETLREFKSELKAGLEQTSSGEFYSEQRFQKVKALIDQLAGRSPAFQANPEAGKKWRELVTDVRHWHSFSASERLREDESEREHFRDSGGKSGGQKEKLAYTILASALAFQFGLSREQGASRSFRFVMIDEAFGKGSDESTRYALNLFKEFKLQVLVVTPKTKVGVITPFVKSILFVHNQDGQHSSVSPITVAELEAMRAGET